jgi:hypothetical protein
VTIVLTPKYLIKFIVRQNVEILRQKKKLRKDIYRQEEISGTKRIGSVSPVGQTYLSIMMTPFVNLVK